MARIGARGVEENQATVISNPKFCPRCGASLVIRELADRPRPVCPRCGFIFYLNPIVAVGALIESGGRVALVQRGVEPGRELWGLPAGYVEADETTEEAVVREALEETHLHVEVEGLLDAYSYGREQDRGVLLVYGVRLQSGTLEAGDDAIAAAWFGPEELPEIAFRTHHEVLHKWRQARSVVYRAATLAEAEVAVMLSEQFPYDQRDDQALVLDDPDQALYVALDNGQVVGFATVVVDRRACVAHLERIFVHPRYRRWGIGTQLVHTCVSRGRAERVNAVIVQVPVSNPGWTVYLNAGFQVTGFTTSYYAAQSDHAEAALVLSYDLLGEG
ncbi:MAG: GNAT family N-acetyltransferase [Anaerolineae bacterium]|nr:GNAT family N-acetyltransferase [Anaerolineae bacterium]